jgi:glycosyltransferase involved in cell wall biosynthesis
MTGIDQFNGLRRAPSQNGTGGPRESHGPAAAPQAAMAAPYRAVERTAAVDLTLFVACYNEENNITGTLDTIQDTMRDLPLTYEIIVIDDASRDRSVAVIREYQRRNPAAPVALIENPRNRGLSRNFAEAAFLGRGRYYKLMCGDNVDSKECLLTIFKPLGTADVIVPYHQSTHGRGPLRRFLSRAYTRLVNLLSGHALNYYNGCGVYRRADVMRWHSRSTGFGFQAELLVRLLDEGATYVQVPVVGRERQGGSSSALKLRNWLSVARTLLAIAFRGRR